MQNNINNNILLHLSLINSIGPATINKLISSIKLENLNLVYKFRDQELSQIAGLSKNICNKIVLGLENKDLLDQELNLLEKNKINFITILDSKYPELLKNIYLPPTILYYKGSSLDSYKKTLSAVGSRQADNYGQKIVNNLIPEIIKFNYELVSGGALGIDTLVHKAAVINNSRTISVLGSGLLRPYPASNCKLFDLILEKNGTLVSPFSLLTPAKPENFPARNRIISGLSPACLVIQAAYPSGALITAQYALDQGRSVGAVPGPIDNILSAGCHKLIKDGAQVIANIEDLLLLLNDNNYNLNKSNQQNFINKPEIKKPENSSIKDQILNMLQEPIDLEDLSYKIKLSISDTKEILSNLQLDGLIDQNFMGHWYLI